MFVQFPEDDDYQQQPWYHTILLAGIVHDMEALELAAIIQGNHLTERMCDYIVFSGNL